MKIGILKHEIKDTEIDVNLEITTTLNLYTQNVCVYNSCHNTMGVYILDFSKYNDIDFINPSNKIGVSMEAEFYEIENGD